MRLIRRAYPISIVFPTRCMFSSRPRRDHDIVHPFERSRGKSYRPLHFVETLKTLRWCTPIAAMRHELKTPLCSYKEAFYDIEGSPSVSIFLSGGDYYLAPDMRQVCHVSSSLIGVRRTHMYQIFVVSAVLLLNSASHPKP